MKNRHLWLRIASAELPKGFAEKVAHEFNWSRTETEEAIEEYRRFVYLNQVAEHPLSPPNELDLVWHMHLLYTRNYWGPWRNTLERDMHHEPASTVANEKHFQNHYGATRALYLNEFDGFLSEKLWPSLETLRRREQANAFILICFFVVFLSIGAAVFTQTTAYAVIGIVAFVGCFLALIVFGSGSKNRKSFGVSSGDSGDGGCGD